jgi:hypothetical protein
VSPALEAAVTPMNRRREIVFVMVGFCLSLPRRAGVTSSLSAAHLLRSAGGVVSVN